jgi:hypothetical protein
VAGSVVNAASVSNGSTTTISCAMPTGTVQNDVMVAAVSTDWDTYANMTAPAGWALRTGFDNGLNSVHCKVFTKTAGAGEAGPYGFGQGTGSDGVASIVTLRGVDESTSAGLYAVTYTGTTSTTRIAPTVTGATTGSVLVCGAMIDGPSPSGNTITWTAPAGMTERADVQSNAFTSQSVATLLDPGDPTGTNSFTSSVAAATNGGIQWSAVFNATGGGTPPSVDLWLPVRIIQVP